MYLNIIKRYKLQQKLRKEKHIFVKIILFITLENKTNQKLIIEKM